MSLKGNIRLEYYKESGSVDRFINKLNSTLNVTISSSSSSSSSQQLNILITSGDTSERITGIIIPFYSSQDHIKNHKIISLLNSTLS